MGRNFLNILFIQYLITISVMSLSMTFDLRAILLLIILIEAKIMNKSCKVQAQGMVSRKICRISTIQEEFQARTIL